MQGIIGNENAMISGNMNVICVIVREESIKEYMERYRLGKRNEAG